MPKKRKELRWIYCYINK